MGQKPSLEIKQPLISLTTPNDFQLEHHEGKNYEACVVTGKDSGPCISKRETALKQQFFSITIKNENS